MPAVRKLTSEEVQTIERKGVSQRALTEKLYDDLIAQFASGEYAELDLDDGETKPAVRQRMNKAAMRSGVEIKWLRGTGETLKFKVVSSPFESTTEEDDDGGTEDEEQEELAAAPVTEEEFELPELETEPVVTKKPVRKSRVTDRQAFVEAP